MILLISAAFAQEETPSLSEEILLVSETSTIVLSDGKTFKIPSKHWLLSDKVYSTALVKARQLEICQPALDKITETSLVWQDRTYKALEKCSFQFDEDELLIQDLTTKLSSMENRALLAEDRLKEARKNSIVAWAITGGLVLGAGSVVVLSIAN